MIVDGTDKHTHRQTDTLVRKIFSAKQRETIAECQSVQHVAEK